MALRFIDGFDHYTTSELSKKYSAVRTNTSVQTTGARTGAGFLRLTDWQAGLVKVMDQQSTWIVGLAVKPYATSQTMYALIDLRDGTASGNSQIRLDVLTSGTVKVRRGGSTLLGTLTVPLSFSVWSYVELKVTFHASTGSVVVRLNGQEVFNQTNISTLRGGGSAWASTIALRDNTGGYSGQEDFDDFYICDGTGTTNNDFLGDVKVTTLFPSANGTNNGMTPSTGTDHAAVVDDPTPDTTDYVKSNTVGTKDTWTYGDIAGLPDVKGVQLNTLASKSDAGTRAYSAVVRSSGTDYDGTDVYLPIGAEYYREIYETNPGTGSAWSGGDINNAEFGVKVTV